MAVLLTALKLTGIVAVIIILVIVAIAACLMFIPVKYEGRGDIQSREFDIKIRWFFRMIQFCFHSGQGTSDYYIRLFGKRTRFLDKDFLDARKEKRAKRKQKKEERLKRKRKKKREKKKKNIQLDIENNIKKNESPQESAMQTSDNGPNASCGSSEEEESGQDGLTGKVKKILHGVTKSLQLLKEHKPLGIVWPELQKLLNHITPRVLKADLIFGFTDPSLTGKVLGAISNLYFIYQFEDFHLSPDFETEKNYIEGSFLIRGNIRGIHLLGFLIRLIRKKEFRKFLGALKKSRNGGKS